MNTLPLIVQPHPGAPLFWHRGAGVHADQLVADAQALAARLPPGQWLLNLCESRYAFTVAFAAGALSGRTSLLPPGTAPEMLQALCRSYPGCVAVSDRPDPGSGLPAVSVPAEPCRNAPPASIPALPRDQLMALVFTSGSTGTPQPQAKTWGSLVQGAGLAVRRFAADGAVANVVATVPAQHMYGLETTVMLPLAGGWAAHVGRPFFPEDVRAALAEIPQPRVLVTTPVHLRACVAGDSVYPALDRVISATAPLPVELATRAEARLQAPVYEIYGCTEAGSLATRRTTDGDLWRLYDRLRLQVGDDGAWLHGPHLAQPVALQDVIEPRDDDHFRLAGRSADMIKVAGKRMSLAELTQQLLAIPGVQDAVVFQPPGDALVQRPAALVVAPALSEAQILDALARRVDAVFLPRPLRRVPGLPRNAVGKLPHADLLQLLRT